MRTRRLGVSRALIDGTWVGGDVTIADGRVHAVGVAPAGGGGDAVPGFVDLQVNGFAGVDFSEAEPSEIARASAAMSTHGVTSFAPTIPTADPARYDELLRTLSAASADCRAGSPRVLGVHLEGPFLSPDRPGAHRVDWLQPPDAGLAMTWCDLAPIAIMTVAPELANSLELISSLRSRGVIVSIGHTAADATDAHRAFDHGCSMVTHLWNAQPQMTSRLPGPIGVALSRPDVHVGMIADLVHVAPETLLVSLAAAGRRAFVVTDATAEAGRSIGADLNDGRSLVPGGGAVQLAGGTLAGSATPLDVAVRNLVSLGLPLDTVVHTVTTAPANAIGRSDIGRLRVGGAADVVVLDDNLAVTEVLLGGVPWVA